MFLAPLPKTPILLPLTIPAILLLTPAILMPLQLEACHPGEEAEEEENLPVLAIHFEQDSAEPYYLFDQLEEDNSDLALEAAQVKCKAEAANTHLLLADLNVGHMHSERRRKNGITMYATLQA
ncbi:hypothetical protein EV424DRAFT_1538058 [Suillus variegatus]|nr:hypothetical protein EV424DRAFT_1538058 [Suillus variegatus]